MRGRTRIALLAGVSAIALGGCGSSNDGTIPMDQSENLLNLLAAVQTSVTDGDCDLAAKTALELTTAVNNLPSDVDQDVQSELTKAAGNLTQLAQDPTQCVAESGATGPTGIETTESSTTTTSITEPESTTTNPEDTSDQQPTEDPNQEQPDTGTGQGDQGTGQGTGGTSSGGTTAGGGGG
jgi:hypothetical protein